MYCIFGLPIYEITTTAEILDSMVALDILVDTHSFLPVTEYTFLVDRGYDVKNIYNQVHVLYNDECIIPLNKHNAKNSKLLPQENPVCETWLAIHGNSKYFKNCYSLCTECERYNFQFKNTGQEGM